MKLFGDRLREVRGFRSQSEIARVCGVSQTTYSYWEKGKTEPSIEKISKICEFFSVSSDYLIGLSDDPRPNRGGPVSANNSAVAIGGGNASNHVEVHEHGADGAVGRHTKKDVPGEDAHRAWFSSERDVEKLKEQIEADLRDEIARSVLDALSHIQHDHCGSVDGDDGSAKRKPVKRIASGGGCALGGCGTSVHCVACAKKE